jgi:hypothetical protein
MYENCFDEYACNSSKLESVVTGIGVNAMVGCANFDNVGQCKWLEYP